ncbi:MAG: sugar ABC transporter ATP-binding protein [Lachnospiraceae bacterium]|nr:sugar ABC transporter ATP-binding protein [Lachnospiraceae bacterium]
MHNIVKEFPGVKALKGVDLKVRPGTVHALMGENGAGKSTLMKCLIGIQPVTSGEIIYKGQKVSFKSAREAIDAGISMIHQEMSPVLERSVCDNVWLGREPKNGIFTDHKKMKRECIELFKKMGQEVDPDEKMKNLSVAKMQMVEIVKAVSYNSSIVIMDEPTSSLTEKETEDLFDIIKDLKERGTAIIYISHKMDEIFRISDEISVFRDGEFIGSDLVENFDQNRLIKMMVGREITNMFPKTECPIGDVVLKVENLCAGRMVQNVSFEVRKGEILGFAGLVGAGRTETVETVFGIRKKDSGKIIKDGKELDIRSPQDAIENHISLLTEDRRGNGIIGLLSVRENMCVAKLNLKMYGTPLDRKRMKTDTQEYIEKIKIKTPTMETPIMNLSGGNQQKVLVGRWLLTEPDVLIVDEPTRGIDVGAKAEIHTLLSELAGQGKAIIVISSEMPEVMGVADKIIVMHEGHVSGTLERSEFSQELIMEYATTHEH